MARKDFAKMDQGTGRRPQSVLAKRFDQSRVVPFDAPLSKLAPNPYNPRNDTDPAVQEMAASMTAVGQLQTAVVLTRDAFLEAYPDAEDLVPEAASWVTFMGNRRLAAARLAGKDTLEVVIANDVATAEQIEDAIIHENLHREGLPPLREAGMLERKMQREGLSARALADKIGKSHAYVNQRLSLTKLIPEFQAMLTAEELGMKDARKLASETPERQRELLAVWPQVAKLVPAARALFDDGELDDTDLERLANLSPVEQRKLVAGGLGGNPVSIAPAPSSSSTDEETDATPAGNSVSTAPTSGEASVDDAPASARADSEKRAKKAPTPADVAKYVRARLDRDGIDELVRILQAD